MQATRVLAYEDCCSRSKLADYADDIMQSHITSASGRNKNWNDIDGKASGQNEPTIIRRRRADAGQGRNDEDDDFTFEELLDGSKVL